MLLSSKLYPHNSAWREIQKGADDEHTEIYGNPMEILNTITLNYMQSTLLNILPVSLKPSLSMIIYG